MIVFRLAGSKGLWDLISYNPEQKTIGFIQVKRNCKPTKAEFLAMEKFPANFKAVYIWWKGKKEPEIITIK